MKTVLEDGFKQTEIWTIPKDWDVVKLSDESIAEKIVSFLHNTLTNNKLQHNY